MNFAVKQAAFNVMMLIEQSAQQPSNTQLSDAIASETQQLLLHLGRNIGVRQLSPGQAALYLVAAMLAAPDGVL